MCHAVNTVKYENNRFIGHISDGKGFFMSCEEKGWFIQNQKVVVLGAGGAACAIIVEAALQGAKEIIVYNRSDKPFICLLYTSTSVKTSKCKNCPYSFSLPSTQRSSFSKRIPY